MDKIPHVLIIGAGISGLVLAQGLKKNGISFEIFEREDSASYYRPREWGMSLHWSLPMLRALLPDELNKRFRETTATNPYIDTAPSGLPMPVLNGQTGELLKEVPLPEVIRVSRRKMRKHCATGLDIQYGKTLTEIDFSTPDNVTVTFSDTTTASGTLLVAADGANSKTRELVFNDSSGKSHCIPYTGINMHACYHDATVSRLLYQHIPVLGIGAHPDGYWLWLSPQEMPDLEEPEDWVWQLQWTWRISSETEHLAKRDLVDLKRIASESFSEPFKTAWTKLPQDSVVSENRISVWEPVPIPNEAHQGRVALVGDAAHAMSFHRGQGLNHGINDAMTLVTELGLVREGKKDAKSAIAAYESQMIARAGEEVRISGKNTEMMHDWKQLLNSPFITRGSAKN